MYVTGAISTDTHHLIGITDGHDITREHKITNGCIATASEWKAIAVEITVSAYARSHHIAVDVCEIGIAGKPIRTIVVLYRPVGSVGVVGSACDLIVGVEVLFFKIDRDIGTVKHSGLICGDQTIQCCLTVHCDRSRGRNG